MSQAKQLTEKQLAVIEDLFSGELHEQAVLKKHKVSRKLYIEWQSDNNFVEQFDRRIAGAYRQSAALIARYAPLAAARLVALTESDKAETARKACLDIISMPRTTSDFRFPIDELKSENESRKPEISQQIAGKLLAVLAEQKND
jgi:hypothetical protein